VAASIGDFAFYRIISVIVVADVGRLLSFRRLRIAMHRHRRSRKYWTPSTSTHRFTGWAKK